MSSITLSLSQDSEGMKPSPSVVAFEQELENILLRFAKRVEGQSGEGYFIADSAPKRKVNFSKLFKEYKPRLQHHYFVEKLAQIGNFLCSVKAFRMAKFQCFTRYLQEISPDFTCIEAVADCSFDEFQETFFGNGLDDVQTIDTMRVLHGDAVCSYQLLAEFDPKLQNSESVVRCENLLKILRLTTRLALHQESFSWLVFNGTIHMYTISRQLMVTGHSALVLEYLLWACMCMEASIPLLTLKYVPWRSTLYVAVSLCYLDCKEPQHAETFARRAMKKINELSDIEEMSTSVSTPETKAIFQTAKVKINAIIFQRVVFELRKRPKGLLRPKARPPLKEALHQNWPRSQTERLLSDLFDGSAAQFLAILQTLADPHRRTLQCKAPTGAIDDITLDIYPELFVAGVDLISGGNSGTRGHRHDPEVHPSCIELSTMSLLHLSEQGCDGVPLPFVAKFMKLAFSYEQWEVLDVLLHPFISLLKMGPQLVQTPAYVMALRLLAAMEPFFNMGRKQKRIVSYNSESGLQENPQGNKSTGSTVDDLLVVANILHDSSSELPKSSLPYLDVDMIIDATLFLWTRCKSFFQRVVSCNLDSCRQVINDPDCDKWLYILLTIHNVLHWSGLSDVDAVMTGEVALKLALVLECRAATLSRLAKSTSASGLTDTRVPSGDQQKSKTQEADINQKFEESPTDLKNKPYQVAFPNSIVDLLYMAFNILESSVERLTEAREKMDGNVQKAIEGHKASVRSNSTSATENSDEQLTKSPANTAVQTIHLELLFNSTRLLAKLDAGNIGSQTTGSTEKTRNTTTSTEKPSKKDRKEKASPESWSAEIIRKYNKRALTKALLLMHQTQIQDVSPEVAKQRLQECFNLIKKAQTQEKVLAAKSKTPDYEHCEPSTVPPPPIVVSRSSSKIVLKPAPFKPLSKEKVHWYRVFGCSATGSNVKVRLNDSDLTGTGEEVPQGPDSKFHISNLREGERYVFAVAAYSKDGALIGGGIGPTGHAVPACHPMPVLMPWGYLAQTAYSCGAHDIAKAAAEVLWKFFVSDCESSTENMELAISDEKSILKIISYSEKRLESSNQALVRQFLQSIFISVDITVQEGKLFCDSFCDYGPLLPGQINRIQQCGRMLLSLKVALWLNDNTLVLQSIAKCYGLLAPLVQLKIPARPVVQVLLQCYAVLQEIPSLSRYRKHSTTSDSLYHLIAVVTFYLSKVLPLWGEHDLAQTIRDYGRKLLSIDPPPESTPSVGTTQANEGQSAAASLGQKPHCKKNMKNKVAGAKKAKGTIAKVNTKPEQANKAGSFQQKEFLALESYFARVHNDVIVPHRNDSELTGSEDPSILNTYIIGMNIQEAYREVIKFKRRTKYLRYFVQVAEKAFDEGMLEKVLEWSTETEQWLYKRNDLLMPTQKPSLVRATGEHGGEEIKNKKFGTTIVEYGKPGGKKPTKSMRQLLDTLSEVKGGGGAGRPEKPVKPEKPEKHVKPDKPVKTEKSGSIVKPGSGHKSVPRIRKDKSRKKGRTPEEQDLIGAIEILQSKLPDFWRTQGKKRKLRTLTTEEIPWRCQWNVLRGIASLRMFLRNTAKHDVSNPESARSPLIGADWFSFDITGILIPRRSGSVKEDSSLPLKAVVSSSVQDTGKASSGKKRDVQRTEGASESVRNVFSAVKYLSKAVVLAFRGKCWGLLQNACCHLWNVKQKLQDLVADPKSALSEEILHEIIWPVFYTAADCLLDMVVALQRDKTETLLSKNKSPPPVSVPGNVTFWGDIEDEKGGSDLVFEDLLDDQSTADVVWIKRVVMYSMELLFYQDKWEKLADVVLRFNAVTRGRYAESVLPILAIAQEKLRERAEQNGGLSVNQPQIELSAETGKPEGLTISTNSFSSFEPAVHIDPRGHDIYWEDNEALRLFCVPVDKTGTLQQLKQSVEMTHCAARSLKHSRQLLLRYLAGLYQQKKGTSRVAFAPADDHAVTSLPPALGDQRFDKVEDVQKCPLSSSQLAVVITSYDKTIEMLQFHGRKALLAQAMNEMGNIMFHTGNKRSALRWWQTVLDTILSPVAPSKPPQHSHNPYLSVVHLPPLVLLRKRGMWGCLLGAITAVNIARYIHTDNMDKRLDYCCVAASLLQALFSSSLPHPTACCDFALYDIGNGYPVGSLIPGVNLFSDPFRCDAKVFLTSIVWLAEEMIETGHFVKVLPLLTLARYLASDSFDDETWVMKVLILRIRALRHAGLYSQSYTVLSSLFVVRNTKRPFKGPASNIQSAECFECGQPVTDKNNVQVLNNLICLRLSPATAFTYGSELSRCLILEQARLMVAIASAIYAIPFDAKAQLRDKLSGVGRSQMSTPEVPKPSKISQAKLFDENVTESAVKSYLMAGAEILLEERRQELLGDQKNLRDYLDSRGQLFKPSDLKHLILIELDLASIRQQHLECLAAAKIVYTCMRALEEASVILEQDQKRSGSAWTAFSRSSDVNKSSEVLREDLSPVANDLDPHLWLACRLKMVECLSGEDNSIGRIAGFSRTVVALTGSVEQHCEQGIDEAEAFGSSEVLCEFQTARVLLKLQRGALSQSDIEEVKNIIDILENLHPLSAKGRLLLVKLFMYYGDFIGSFGESMKDSGFYYLRAEKTLCDEIKEFGGKLNYSGVECSTLVTNIYLPHLLLLAETKLRIARVRTRMTDQSTDIKQLLEVLGTLLECLALTRAMKIQQNPLEGEFLYLVGMLQHFLWLHGQCSDLVVMSSFIDAITSTYNFEHNLELMRKCYEQLACFYLTKTQQVKPEVVVEEVAASSSVTSRTQRANTKLSRKEKEDKAKEKKQDVKTKRETKKELKAAWIAIRAAATLTAVLSKRGLLLGDVTELSVTKATGDKIPDSAMHDLLGAVSIVRDPVDKSCVKDDGIVTMESYVNGSNLVHLTWVHLVSHVNYLQRQVRYHSLGVKNVDHGGPLFRWRKLLKLFQMRQLLTTELDVYFNTCSGVSPSPLLLLPDTPLKQNDESTNKGKNVDEAEEYEIAVQWLSGDELWSDNPSAAADAERELNCLYAFNNKAVSSITRTGISAGSTSVSYKSITEVHEQLRALLELTETDQNPQIPSAKPSKPELPASQVSTAAPSTSRKKRAVGVRAYMAFSSLGRGDAQVQSNLKDCLSALIKMMKPSQPSEKKEIPFEGRYTNIRILENIFDPSGGFIGKVSEPLYTWLTSLFH